MGCGAPLLEATVLPLTGNSLEVVVWSSSCTLEPCAERDQPLNPVAIVPVTVTQPTAVRPPTSPQPAPRSTRVRGALINVALMSVSVLLAALVGEAAVRLAAPQQLVRVRPDVWMPADTFGWTHRPNLNTTFNTGEGAVRIFTDHEGYRVSAAGRVEAERSILVLGDSYMAAFQVEYEESVPGRLEAGLANAGLPVSVRNTGVTSWDPPHYLMRARHALARERFDMTLVFVYLGNDIVPSRTDAYRPRVPVGNRRLRLPRRVSRREFVNSLLYPVDEFLKANSHMYVMAKNASKVLLMRTGLTARVDPVELRVSEAEAPRWTVTADILSDIAAESARYGTPTLFVLIPTAYQVNRQEFEDYLRGFGIDESVLDIDQPNRIMRSKLAERGLEFVDTKEALRAAHEAGEKVHGRVDPHFSAGGHAVVARMLEPILLERLGGETPTGGQGG